MSLLFELVLQHDRSEEPRLLKEEGVCYIQHVLNCRNGLQNTTGHGFFVETIR